MERDGVVGGTAKDPDDAEQQVGLLLGRRQSGEQGQDLVVARYRPSQVLIGRGHTARLTSGELLVPPGNRHVLMVTVHLMMITGRSGIASGPPYQLVPNLVPRQHL